MYTGQNSSNTGAANQLRQRNKLIVDKDTGQTMEGIHDSVVAALQAATSNTTIKIASDLYEE